MFPDVSHFLKDLRVNEAVNERNECVRRLNARHGMRTRHGEGQRTAPESQAERGRVAVRNARKEVKRFMRRIERKWWTERINECKEACDRGRIGYMYKCLRKIGTKGVKAAQSNITVSDFKGHFESVSRERYEEDPNVIECD